MVSMDAGKHLSYIYDRPPGIGRTFPLTDISEHPQHGQISIVAEDASATGLSQNLMVFRRVRHTKETMQVLW